MQGHSHNNRGGISKKCDLASLMYSVADKFRVKERREEPGREGEMLTYTSTWPLLHVSGEIRTLSYQAAWLSKEVWKPWCSLIPTVDSLHPGGRRRIIFRRPSGEIYRVWCCLLFGATSNPRITGWTFFFLYLLTRNAGICQRTLISSLAHCLFFH